MAIDLYSISGINSNVIPVAAGNRPKVVENDGSFASIFETALNMINETNELQNRAEEKEVQFMLGDAENTHDLMIAEQKANIALQYTVAVRDKVLEGYNTLMNMQG